jgi:hypothetical protein
MSAELTRAIKHALKRAFSTAKFSVKREMICWTDDGPEVAQVKDVLLNTGCAISKEAWNGEHYLYTTDGYRSFYFDRYNAAERTAEIQDRERRIAEAEVEQQRVNAVVAAAQLAKRARIEPLRSLDLSGTEDPIIFTAFEQLRQRAEAEVVARSTAEDQQRRPSWAPPLILGEELAQICRKLGMLAPDDKPIGRLWATFATPKRSGRVLREHVSQHPLKDIGCRGFQFYAGGERGTRSDLLFEAQREESGEWRFGPRWWPAEYYSPRARAWEHLVRRRENAPSISLYQDRDLETHLAEINRQIEVIDAEDLVEAKKHRDRQQLRQRQLELARARVLDFIGAADAQMQLAARLCGHCCVCFKELTDPISLERGIGPDCLSHKVEFIRSAAADGRTLEYIRFWSGMPTEFITAVLNERAA